MDSGLIKLAEHSVIHLLPRRQRGPSLRKALGRELIYRTSAMPSVTGADRADFGTDFAPGNAKTGLGGGDIRNCRL